MRVYKSKEELKAEINKTFDKYISEFDCIPEALKDKRVDAVDRTPAENLAYQVGWTTLVLKWEEDERKGLQVKTPSDEFKWNQLGELYSGFSREDAIFVISIQVTTKEYTCVFALMFQNGKFLLYSLGVHPNFFRKASLKWLMLLYPTNPAMSFT